MTVTARTDAALRAALALARPGRTPADVVPISRLAGRTGLSRPFLQQVLLALKHRGLVTSRGGRAGGYRLARRPAEISVGDVLRAMQGDLAPMACAADEGCVRCEAEARCTLRPVWRRVRAATGRVVDGVRLSALAGR